MPERPRTSHHAGFYRHDPAWTGPTPEEVAIDREDTQPNRERKAREEEQEALEEQHLSQVRQLMEAELASLDYDQVGCLTAYWNDVLHYPYDTIAERLNRKVASTKTAKCRALALHVCSDAAGRCDFRRGCAHRLGQDVWERVISCVCRMITSEVV